MATANEVKLFKQYLIDSNTFQTLVKAMSLLYKSDPKPKDAMQFIREHMTQTVDSDEFRNIKENLSKLNEDMEAMKANVHKITSIITKLLPEQPSIDEIPTNMNASMSSSMSMENNVGDVSHISMLDDNSLIFDESSSNVNQSSETMPTVEVNEAIGMDTMDASQAKEKRNDSAQGYTIEIIELDVVDTKDSLDTTIATASQGMKVEDMQIDDVGCESVVTSTPEKTTTDKLNDVRVSDMDIKIEDLPIYMKDENDCEELSQSQGFLGFNAQDLENSKDYLEKIEFREAIMTSQQTLDDRDEPKTDQVAMQQPSTLATVQMANATSSQDIPIEDIHTDEEKRSIVMEILDKVVENVTELDATETVADVQVDDGSKTDMSVTKIGDKAFGRPLPEDPLPEDDAESRLFLSFS